MHGLSSLIVIALSFVSLAFASPTTRSSRLAKDPISSRQFQYPRTLLDVCADIDLSVQLKDVLGLDLDVLGDICLCLSAFPLDLKLDARLQVLTNLLGETKVNALLRTLVNDNGSQCTYPDHASPVCTSGNPCGFTCTDGFVQVGNNCVCPPPNTVCNGKCGSYQNGCGSALPKAPKMERRSIASYDRRGPSSSHPDGPLNVDPTGLKLGSSSPDLSKLDLVGLVNGVLKSNGISGPIDLDLDLTVDVSVVLGGNLGSISGVGDIINTIIRDLLSALLGTNPNQNSSPTPTLPGQGIEIVIDIDLSGILGTALSDAIDQLLDDVLSLVSELLTDLLHLLGLDLDVEIVVNVNGEPDHGLYRSKSVSVKA